MEAINAATSVNNINYFYYANFLYISKVELKVKIIRQQYIFTSLMHDNTNQEFKKNFY